MNRIAIIILFLLTKTYFCLANSKLVNDTARAKPIFIVCFYDRQPIITSNNFADRSSWEFIHFLQGSQYDVLKKTLGVSDLAIVKIKPKTKLLMLSDLFSQYNIAEKYRHLKVMYDDDVLDHPETLIITSKQIVAIKILKLTTGTFVDIIGIDYNDVEKLKKAEKRGEPLVGGHH
jgi:hypothetical protein